MDRYLAGKALYDERAKLLHGLWMADAVAWEELPEEVKERWCGYADQQSAERRPADQETGGDAADQARPRRPHH
jgi:hypothetical protein